jgi:hypothetical protein
MNASMQISKVRLEVLPIFTPGHAIHPRRCLRTKRPIGRSRAVDRDVVQKRGELYVPVLQRHLAHTVQVT